MRWPRHPARARISVCVCVRGCVRVHVRAGVPRPRLANRAGQVRTAHSQVRCKYGTATCRGGGRLRRAGWPVGREAGRAGGSTGQGGATPRTHSIFGSGALSADREMATILKPRRLPSRQMAEPTNPARRRRCRCVAAGNDRVRTEDAGVTEGFKGSSASDSEWPKGARKCSPFSKTSLCGGSFCSWCTHLWILQTPRSSHGRVQHTWRLFVAGCYGVEGGWRVGGFCLSAWPFHEAKLASCVSAKIYYLLLIGEPFSIELKKRKIACGKKKGSPALVVVAGVRVSHCPAANDRHATHPCSNV